MFCYNCGCRLSEKDFCTGCGADVSLYKRIMYVSNMYYNEGLERAGVRDLTGAVTSLRQSLKFNKNNIEARNLLGLVYFELGEVVAALSEWVISKNLSPERNIADDYIEKLQSNATRLDSVNQTIKKYNQALLYCMQDSKDLAVIQLKKVLSLNPKFVRAHQLLALLYMDKENWERAERELKKCLEIDRNDIQTLRYMQEVEQMLVPDETVRQPAKSRKDEAVRYQSDNEIIIQPLSVKEPKHSGISTLLNLGIGLIIGLGVMYFLVVPSVRTETENEAKQEVIRISNESDARMLRIQGLEKDVAGLNTKIEELNAVIDNYAGDEGLLKTLDRLQQAAADYLRTGERQQTADELELLLANTELEQMPEGFRNLYQGLMESIGPKLSEEYYQEGSELYRTEDYTAAIELFNKAVRYDEENVDALFNLGRAYERIGDTDNAIATYEMVLEKFPDSERAASARRYRDQLAAGRSAAH